MESYGELLPGISLDSVVEKASELERILRSCKIAAAHETLSTPPLQEGRGHTSSKVNASDLPSPHSEVDGDLTGLNTHWHQLSTYIVGLEKEIQYYKQLVDDNQRVAVAGGGHTSAQEQRRQALQPLSRQSRPGYVSPHKSEMVFAADNEFWTKLLEGQYALYYLISLCLFASIL